MTGVSPLIPIIAGGLFAIGCLIGAFFSLRRKRIIDDTPTSKTQGVFIGQVELKGTAESENPLSSYLASVKCVQYSWNIEEHWSRTVVETYTDSKGHVQTRTRTESGWTRVADGVDSTPFYLKDDTGVIRILPDGANIQGNQTFNETCTPSSSLYYGKGPLNSVANSTHKRRFTETAIPLHTMLYIMGRSRERQDIVAVEIARDNISNLFLISTRSEKQISSGYAIWYWVLIVSGLLISGCSGLVWAMIISPNSGLNWQPIIIMIFGYFFIFLFSWVLSTYNKLINLHHQAGLT